MARWIELNAQNGSGVFHVNLDRAAWIEHDKLGGARIYFSGAEGDYVDVRESPEQVISKEVAVPERQA